MVFGFVEVLVTASVRYTRVGSERGWRVVKTNRTVSRNGKQPPVASKKNSASHATPDEPAGAPPSPVRVGLIVAALTVVIGWTYWPVFGELVRAWSKDPQYSHGYLVPLFSLFLFWRNRGVETVAGMRPSWWGLPILLAGLGLYLAGAYVFFDWFQAISLLPVLAGAMLLIGGWTAFRRTALPIAFLVFMLPLPHSVSTALSQPLQRIATLISTYALQTVGLPAIAEGNVIVINEARIGVVEACNGLGMMLLFFAIATGVAILVDRPWWQKIVLVFSAVPIAVIANVARIAVTGLLTGTVGQDWVDWIFHDVAGWFMMPLALGLLGLELMFLSRLFVDVETRTTRLQIEGIALPRNASDRKSRFVPSNGASKSSDEPAGSGATVPAATVNRITGE